jgi:hypothetical protein
MPNRKVEMLITGSFRVGESYSREQIAAIGQVAPLVNSREWTGIVEFSNCILLFSTLDKTDLPPEHNYADCFSGEQFKWESQNVNTQKTLKIQRILSGEAPVLLFCRVHKKDTGGRAVPFIYAGQLSAVRPEGKHPVQILFDLLDFKSSPNEALAALYAWRPQGGARKLDAVELPPPIPPNRGQGRQSDTKKRIAIEEWAMAECRHYYEGRGFRMQDTSKTNPFDFIATRNVETRRIEAKGCTGGLGEVIVTAGEVLAAREVGVFTDLFVMSKIKLSETEPGKFRGYGGKVTVVRNWVPLDEDLTPTQFRYAVV